MSKDLTSEGIWQLTFEGYDASTEGGLEALLASGNGYLGIRAAAPEAAADGIHYPGTYRAGLYNRLVSRVNGEEV